MRKSIVFWALLKRDIVLAYTQGGSAGVVIAFFMITLVLYPFGVGPDPIILANISVGVIWVTALLSCLLSLDRLFQMDREDGSLDDVMMSPLSLEMSVLAKTIAHWVATILPIIILAPLLASLLNMPQESYGMLLLSLAIGTPALSFIGAIGAALTLTIKRGSALVALLILPLYIPTLIFGVGAVSATTNDQNALPHLLLLGAVSLLSMLISPIASAAAIKMAQE